MSRLVLVLTHDLELVRLLGAMLAADNREVIACPDTQALRALRRPLQVEAVVIDWPHTPEVDAMLDALRAASELRPEAQVLSRRETPGLLDLVDRLRDAPPPVARVSPAKSPAQGLAVMASARRLAHWWSTRASGVLQLDDESGGWVLLAQGGPVGADGLETVRAALEGREISLERCEADLDGDRTILATLLWRAAHEAVVGQSVESLVPTPTGLTAAARELPLSPATRRCLDLLGGDTVERIARRAGVDVRVVGTEFAALRWLGVLNLHTGLPMEAEVEVDADSAIPLPDDDTESASAPTPSASEIVLDSLVAQGIAAVSRGDWARAGVLLERAKQRAPTNAVVTAHLGWSRYNDPSRPRAEREIEATDLLEAALQLDSECALAWRYCGEMAIARGDLVEATRCLALALRILS